MASTAESSAADHPRRWRWPPPPVLGVALTSLILLALVLNPLLQLVIIGVERLRQDGFQAIDVGRSFPAILNTIWLGLVVAVLAVAAGTTAAFITERIYGGTKGWLRIGVLLPLFVPGFVSALGFIRAYGPAGITKRVMGLEFPGLFGPLGIVVVLAVNATPIAYLVAVAALRARAEPDLERAARIHGASSFDTLRTILLPLLMPALLGAASLVFVSAVNAFGVPAFLGTPARFSTVTTRIYQDLARASQPDAFSRAILLAIVLVVLATLFAVAAERLLAGMGAATRTGSPTGAVYPARVSLTPSAILSLLIFVTTVAPFIMLILAALTRSVGLPPSPQNLTLAHFSEALHSRYLGALGRSLVLSFTAASIVVALGSLVASLRRHWAGRPFRTAVLLTFAVPGSTLAVAMLLAYGGRLRDTLALILLAYLAKLWGVGHRIVEGAAGSVPPDLFRAARASGASGLTAVATVVARLLRPALVGGWLMVFIIAFHELTMSSLLYGPGTDTVAVVVLNLQQVGNVGVTSAVAVLLTLPALLLALPALAFARTSRTVLGGGE